MKLRTLRYYLREAAGNLIHNRLMSVASILTVASCIFIVSLVYCLAANVDYILGQMEDNIGITVFVHEDLTAEEVQALNDRIAEVPHVVNVVYVSSQEGRDSFIETLPNPELLEGVEGGDVFPRSFDIEIDDLRNQASVVEVLDGLRDSGISSVRNSQQLADIVRTIADVVRAACFVLILILGVISIVIIINTIRITVNARKTEINIMKYIGATDWFIRWPFVVEGVLIGVVGGILPAVICWLGYNRVMEMIQEGLPSISFLQFRPGYDIFSYLFPFDLLLGIFIGMIGSVFSVRRHLKV